MYAGYELFENVARPGSEENIDNEKYEYKFRDWAGAEARGDSLAPFLDAAQRDPRASTRRSASCATSASTGATTTRSWSTSSTSTRRSRPTGRSDTLIVVVNIDPHSVRQTMVHLDTRVWGVEPGEPFEVEDLLTGAQWTWSDHNFVMLDAFAEPVHILHVKGAR